MLNRKYLARAVELLPVSHTTPTVMRAITFNLDEAFKGKSYSYTKGVNTVKYITDDFEIEVGKPNYTQGTAFTFRTNGYTLEIFTTSIPNIVTVFLNNTDMLTLGYPSQWSDIALNHLNAPITTKKVVATIMGSVATILE